MDHNITKTGIWTGGPWEGFDIAALQKGNLQINPNLLSQYVTPGQAAPGSTATAGRTIYLENYGIQIPATENADTYFRFFLISQLTTGTKYTFSCYVDGLINGTYYNFPFFAQGNASMGYIQLNHNGLNQVTFTMTNQTQTAVTDPQGRTIYIMFMDDNGRNIATGQGAFQIRKCKLEVGDKATPWIPNITDSIYTIYGFISDESLSNPIKANQFYEY